LIVEPVLAPLDEPEPLLLLAVAALMVTETIWPWLSRTMVSVEPLASLMVVEVSPEDELDELDELDALVAEAEADEPAAKDKDDRPLMLLLMK
jgi:hypothetical protein